MSEFCKQCGREIVIGESEVTGEPITFNAWSDHVWFFPYDGRRSVRMINAWRPHQCAVKEEERK